MLLITSLASSFANQCFITGTISQYSIKKSSAPNIVFIMADDMGYGDLSCYGSESIRTPFLDKMASEGIRFTDYHSNGSVSTPTRAALLTGNYQQRAGMEGVIWAAERKYGLEQKETTLAEVFKEHGYATGIFGKWHLGYPEDCNPVYQGFDEFKGFLSGNVDYISHLDGSNLHDWWQGTKKLSEEGYSTDLITDHAISFIEKHKTHPFFLYIPYGSPHSPYQSRRDPAVRILRGSAAGKPEPAGSDRKETYKEMIEIMDENVGRIFLKLEDAGLGGNSFVFFCSDNGALSFVGSNGTLRGEKGTPWEGGHRVPAIAWFPKKIKGGSICNQLIMCMDMFPTLLAAARIDELPETDGIDAGKAIFKDKRLPDRTVIWRSRDMKAVRKGQWKYVEMEGKEYLFRIDIDINEKNDMITSNREKALEMKQELSAWESEMSIYVQKFEH